MDVEAQDLLRQLNLFEVPKEGPIKARSFLKDFEQAGHRYC